jgi:hypothetical protein
MVAAPLPGWESSGPWTPPASRPGRGWVALLLAGLVGFAVGAVAVGAVWIITERGGSGGSRGTGPISAPARLGAFPRAADVDLYRSDKGRPLLDRIQSWDRQSAQRLSQSYGGAAAQVQSYSDGQLESRFSLQIVRAAAPYPPFVPYQDAQVLGVARPPQEVLTFGPVACVVQNQPTVGGQSPPPDSVQILLCLRTGPALTVQIGPVTGDLGHRPSEVADLVNEAWGKVT